MPSFAARLRDRAQSLTAADKRMIQAIMADPRTAALSAAGELAARAGVHEATGTRLAQKLGYAGFPDLRGALRAEYIAVSDGGQRVARSVGKVARGDYLADLVVSEIEALRALPDALDQSLLDDAAKRLVAARRIHIFARGHAHALADLAERRLRRFGFDTVELAGENRTIAERLGGLRKGDLVLAFAFRSVPRGLDVVFAHAARLGATRLLIADLAAAPLCPAADLALAAARGRSGDEFQTLSVPMAILNALVLTVAGRHKAATLPALDAVSDLIRQLDPN